MIQPITYTIMSDCNSDVPVAETIAARDNVILKLIAHKVGWAVIADAFGVPRYYVARLGSKISLANAETLATRGLESAPENHAGDGQPSGLPAVHGSPSSESP